MPNGKIGIFDFFVKDQQGNTRVVLTEEVHEELHLCSMEQNAQQGYEEAIFGQTDAQGAPTAANEVQQTRQTAPPGWASHYSDPQRSQVSALNGTANAGKVIGPNMLLKVMAGDNLDVSTEYYYAQNPGSQTSTPSLTALTASLSAILGNGSAGNIIKPNAGPLATAATDAGGALYGLLQGANAASNQRPKAYLNILFFDETMRYVSAAINRVAAPGDNQVLASVSNLVPRNGYAYIYVSNESTTETVWFDELTIKHERGRILQEDHYYPDGLKMAAICSKALSKLQNKYGYQGSFAEEDEETGYNEFALRMYDPQIGRWISTDPYDEFASPYLGMGGDPVNNIDPTGGCSFCTSMPTLALTASSQATSFAAAAVNVMNVAGMAANIAMVSSMQFSVGDGTSSINMNQSKLGLVNMSPSNALGNAKVLSGPELPLGKGNGIHFSFMTPDLKARLEKVINDGLGGFYEVHIQADGTIRIDGTNKIGVPTREQAMFHIMMIEVSTIQDFDMVVDDNNPYIQGGSYELRAIDISDVEKGGSEIFTPASILVHELYEQIELQIVRKGKGSAETTYRTDHAVAKKAEQRYLGVERTQESMKSTQTDGLPQSTGNIDMEYTKDAKKYKITINLVKGNFTNISITAIP
jgi:RHS repeat-associated protein